MPARQFNWFMLTIPHGDFTPHLPDGIAYVKGQREVGASGYDHWQVVCYTSRKRGFSYIKQKFGDRSHVEATRSAAARDYVWKEDTRVDGTQFELGQTPTRRNKSEDWEEIWQLAKAGNIEEISPQIRLCHYRSIRTIASDFSSCVGMERSCFLFYGRTGTGKSRRAWDEAGMDAYSKGINF